MGKQATIYGKKILCIKDIVINLMYKTGRDSFNFETLYTLTKEIQKRLVLDGVLDKYIAIFGITKELSVRDLEHIPDYFYVDTISEEVFYRSKDSISNVVKDNEIDDYCLMVLLDSYDKIHAK